MKDLIPAALIVALMAGALITIFRFSPELHRDKEALTEQIHACRKQLDVNARMLDELNSALDRITDDLRRDFERRYPTPEAREARWKEVRQWLERGKRDRMEYKNNPAATIEIEQPTNKGVNR